MDSYNFAVVLYPLILRSVMLPAGPFPLFQPEPFLVANMFKQHQEKEPIEPFPYWAKLWPSSIALATFIQKHPHILAGKLVAEFAAGLGLPSLVAAAYAKKVWCSDISAQVMQIAEKSATLHQLTNIQLEACNWNKLPDDFNAEVVLLSDINYEPSVFDELEKVLTGLMQQGCTLMLATPQRLMAKPLFEKLSPFITNQFEETILENKGQVFISIFILQIFRMGLK